MLWHSACRDELVQIFQRQRKLAVFLFAVPILCTVCFGAVYGKNLLLSIPTVVYDQDQTVLSRSLIQAFADSERYSIDYQVDSQEDLDALLHENDALAAVTIPANFAKDIKRGRRSQVLVTANGTNILFASAIISSGQEIMQVFTARTVLKLLESGGQLPADASKAAAPIRFGLRLPNNPTAAYNYFVLIGLGANSLQIGIILATCGVMIRQRRFPDQGCRDILGRLSAYWLCAFLAFTLYTSLIILLYGLPCRGNLLEITLLAGVFIATMVSAGAFFSALSQDEMFAVQCPMLYIMPSFLFSGYSWPLLAMNDFGRIFSALSPIHYAADSLRDLMLAGYAPALYSDIMSLLLFTLVFAVATWIIHHRRMREVAG